MENRGLEIRRVLRDRRRQGHTGKGGITIDTYGGFSTFQEISAIKLRQKTVDEFLSTYKAKGNEYDNFLAKIGTKEKK